MATASVLLPPTDIPLIFHYRKMKGKKKEAMKHAVLALYSDKFNHYHVIHWWLISVLRVKRTAEHQLILMQKKKKLINSVVERLKI